jgi:hypothetical protein
MQVRNGSSAVRRWRALVLVAFTVISPAAFAIDAFPDSLFGSDFEACSGYRCAQVHCAGTGTTSISGTLFAPNATLPLPNVEVYVPNAGVDAFVDGPNAPRCDVAPSGHPLVATLTDANGNFTLTNMPATTNVPVVLLAGKWRRQITIPSVAQCTDTPVDAASTRLPATHNEGDIAHIAVAVGAVDALECLIRKIGVADTEFSTNSGSGRIHLFAGTSNSTTNHFDAGLGGATFASASTLWASGDSLSAYDQIMLACDGSQNPNGAISAAALTAMQTYANSGGRVYLAHWQNYWLQQQAGWSAVAGWGNLPTPPDPLTAQVAEDFSQAAIEYDWLVAVGASTTPGTLTILGARQTAISIDSSIARRWISATANNQPSIQLFTFATPVGANPDSQLGRVLFTDMHDYVGDNAAQGLAFPSQDCTTGLTSLSPQEKALAYATFDLQRCVGSTRE